MFFSLAAFSVPLLPLFTASGWTAISPSPDSRIVYVSSSTGNDSNSGLSPALPKASIPAGVGLLRHGFPDWLLLKKGDSWSTGLGQWKKSGRSETERMVVSAYGASGFRPRLRSGPDHGVSTHGGGGSPPRIDHIALIGLHFEARTFGGISEPYGVNWLQPSANFLIEDCFFEKYRTNLNVQGFGGRHSNFQLRRCVIVDAYANNPTVYSQGLYLAETDDSLIEENIFDHNGWHETIPGAHETIYTHNLYVQNGNRHVIVRGNIIANGDGLQLRPGGKCEENLIVRTSIALTVGGGNHPDFGFAGVHAEVRRNVILEGKNISPVEPRGWGMTITGVSSGVIARNVIANNSLGTFPAPMTIDGRLFGDGQDGCCVRNLQIERNVISNWAGSVGVLGEPWQVTGVSFWNNEVQNEISTHPLVDHTNLANPNSLPLVISGDNRFFSLQNPANAWMNGAGNLSLPAWKSMVGDFTSSAEDIVFIEPTASVASYHRRLGRTPTHEAFFAQARLQSKENWRPEYTAKAVNVYVRRCFEH